jgi:hypothetical protein
VAESQVFDVNLDSSLCLIGSSCPFLEEITIDGAFLCDNEGFIGLLNSENLRELTLYQASKLTCSFLDSLSHQRASLKLLDIRGSPLINSVKNLESLECLETLCLDFVGDIGSEEFESLLLKIGSCLKKLSFRGQGLLQDSFLSTISQTCTELKSISLEACTSFTPNAINALFDNLKSPLTHANLDRVENVTEGVITSLISNHGPHLQILQMNGIENLSQSAMQQLSQSLPCLEKIDISWIRSVDDEILENLVTKSPLLNIIQIFGCYQCTPFALNKEWKNSKDEFIRFMGNEFD